MQTTEDAGPPGGLDATQPLPTDIPSAEGGTFDFRIVAEKSLSLVLVVDHTGEIQYVNHAFSEATGYTSAELLGRKIQDLGELDAQTLADLRDTLGLGRPWRGEFAVVKKSGEPLWVYSSISPVTDETGRVTHFLAVNLDISERKRTDEALHESEARFRGLAETTTAATFIFDGANISYANSAASKITGYSESELTGKNFWEIAHPDLETVTRENLDALSPGDPIPSRVEVGIITKDGQTRWLDFSMGFIEIGGRELVLGTGFDITERKAVEEALRDSEERFRRLADSVPAGTFVFQETGFQFVNTAMEALFGYTADEYAQMEFWEVVHPEFQQTVKDRGLARLRGEEVPSQYEIKVIRKDGQVRWGLVTASLIEYKGSPAAIGSIIDITDRKAAEEALRQSEEKFRTLVETMPAAAVIFQGSRVRYANRMTLDALGYTAEDLASLDYWDAVHPDYRELVRERGSARLRGEDVPSGYEVRFLTKTGEPRWGLYSAARITYEGEPAVLGTIYDITERKAAEEALRQSEERYRILYQDNPSMYFTLAEDLSILSVNQHGAEQLGHTPEELIGEPVLKVVHPDDQIHVKRQLEALVRKSGTKHGLEFRKVRKNGEVVWVKESVGVTHDADGARIILVVCEDITEHKHMQEALEGLREELERKAERAVAGKNPYNLSFRELTVLHLVTAGRSDKEIGVVLGIRPQTVSKHVANVLKKMNASSRTEAGVRALREGLIA